MRKKGMDWGRERVNAKLQVESNRLAIERERKDVCLKWELQKVRTFRSIENEKERLQLA